MLDLGKMQVRDTVNLRAQSCHSLTSLSFPTMTTCLELPSLGAVVSLGSCSGACVQRVRGLAEVRDVHRWIQMIGVYCGAPVNSQSISAHPVTTTHLLGSMRGHPHLAKCRPGMVWINTNFLSDHILALHGMQYVYPILECSYTEI